MKHFITITLFTLLSTVFMAQLSPGSVAPDFTGTDIEGEQHQLSDYTAQGKWVLLKFGFITCSPCHDATFGLNMIYHGFGCNDQDLIVLGVDPINTGADYDTYWDTWDPPFTPEGTIQSSHVLSSHNYPVIPTDGGGVSIADNYQVVAAPAYFLINPDGILVEAGDNNIFANLQTFIANYFDVYGSLELHGIDPVLNTIGAEQYYYDNILPNIEADNFETSPMSEYCADDPIGNGDACSEDVATNVQLTIDQDINEVTATWEGSGACTDYYITVYSSGVLTGQFDLTTSGNTATFTGLPPGDYQLGILCTCNSTYESSDPVEFTIDFDEIITDFTDDECTDVCNYTLTLTTSDNIAGGAIDWLSQGYFLELVIDGVSGGFWLTDQELTNSWNITACTNDSFEAIIHAEGPAGFIASSGAHIKLVTSTNATVFDVDVDSYLDTEDIGITEVDIFSGSVNCDLECNPSEITNSTIITDPPNITIIDWDDDAGCSSYTVRWRTTDGEGFWTESTVSESQFQIPFVFTFLGQSDIEYQIRCNCAGGGVGSFSPMETFTYVPYSCNPATPINLETTNIGATIANVQWGSTNNQPCSTYSIRIREEGGTEADWFYLLSSYSYFEFPNLTPNTTYEIQVACTCSLIDSPYTESVFFTTLEVQDCSDVIIQNIQTSNITSTSAQITWDENSACDTYTVRYLEMGGTLWNIVNSTSEALTISELTPNSQYSAQVRCNCTDAIGEYNENVTISTVVGIENIDLTIWSVYPNPTKESLFIQRKDNTPGFYNIILTDLVGRVVFNKSVNKALARVDVSKLSSGTYVLQIITEDNISQKARIVVE